MKKNLLAIFVLSSFLLTSCGNGDKKETTTSTSQSENIEVDRVNETTTSTTGSLLANPDLLNKAENDLKELAKFKGKEIKVFQKINIYDDGRIIMAIQDPDKPENVDEYTYLDGKWQAPQALQISGGGNMDDNTFPLSQVKFETANAIFKQLQEKAKTVEGAEPVTTAFYNMNPATGEMRWLSGIDGTRESYTAIFNTDGSLKSFEKN